MQCVSVKTSDVVWEKSERRRSVARIGVEGDYFELDLLLRYTVKLQLVEDS